MLPHQVNKFMPAALVMAILRSQGAGTLPMTLVRRPDYRYRAIPSYQEPADAVAPVAYMEDWIERSARFEPYGPEFSQFVLFSGKRRVGKTTMAAATAIAEARAGRRTLIVTIDPVSNLADVFEQPIGHQITPVASMAHLWAMEIDPDAAVERNYHRAVSESPGVCATQDIPRYLVHHRNGGDGGSQADAGRTIRHSLHHDSGGSGKLRAGGGRARGNGGTTDLAHVRA